MAMSFTASATVSCFSIQTTSLLRASADKTFPSFLPKEVRTIKDPDARKMAQKIQLLPVQTSLLVEPIMSSCVKSQQQRGGVPPLLLLHGFDSSCLEWRFAFPLLEDAGLEAWAVDILGWGFSNLATLPSCSVVAKREHLYQFWRTYVKKPMILVGPSLGAAVAIDFTAFHPEAVSDLVLIDASVYAQGTGNMAKLPKALAYAGASILKSIPLRLYANTLVYKGISPPENFDRMKVGRLHCLLPWWDQATVDFMLSGGYNVKDQLKKISKRTLIIWGLEDRIISKEFAQKLQEDMPNSFTHQITGCGHLPHVEQPRSVVKSILEFISNEKNLI